MRSRISRLPSKQNKLLHSSLQNLLLAEGRSLASLRRAARAQPDDLIAALTTTILTSRIDARKVALAAAQDETEQTFDAPPFTDEDYQRSHAVAASLAGALGLALIIGEKNGRTPDQVLALEDYRLRRIAGTEVPHAYAGLHYSLEPEGEWARRWDATLDRSVCKLCSGMHGAVVPLGEEFPGGLVPGEVHVNCRCVPTLIPLALLKAA